MIGTIGIIGSTRHSEKTRLHQRLPDIPDSPDFGRDCHACPAKLAYPAGLAFEYQVGATDCRFFDH
jgi:hypothetical protein